MLTTPIAANRASWRGIPAGTPGTSGQRVAAELGAQLGERQAPDREGAPDARDAPQVGDGGGDDVDAAVRVVDPVHRHLVDAQARALGQHQQLGVEEPAGVLDQRQQPPGDVGADGLEAALGVGEPGRQRAAQQQVVGARDELPLRPADHPRRRGRAGCRWPGRSARRSAGRPAAAGRRGRWRGRRRSRPAPARRRPPRPSRSARPRPFSASRTAATPASSAASARAIAGVASVLALSAMVIRNGYGNCAVRWAYSRRTDGSRSVSSLWTGTTTSSTTRLVSAGCGPGSDSVQAGLRDVDAHVVHARPRRCPALVVDLCASCASGPVGCSGHEAVPVRS